MQKVFDQLHERVAGLEVHNEQVTAAVRVPDGDGGRLQDVAEISTTVPAWRSVVRYAKRLSRLPIAPRCQTS